jgi:hypothetical protein
MAQSNSSTQLILGRDHPIGSSVLGSVSVTDLASDVPGVGCTWRHRVSSKAGLESNQFAAAFWAVFLRVVAIVLGRSLGGVASSFTVLLRAEY